MEVTEKHGLVRIVPVHVNSNQSACTLEQILASKKHTHMAAFSYGLQELQRDLSQMCNQMGPARYATDVYKEFRGKKYTCESLLENIMAECKQKLQTHEELEADEFAKDEIFRRLVTEMLDVKTMAMSKLRLWLEDSSRYILTMEKIPIRDAHKQLLGYLKKRMQHENPHARRLTVMQICKLKGLLDTSVDGTHGLKQWGTRLVSAAAEGVSSYDFELLLEAGSGEHHKLTSSAASGQNVGEEQLVLLSEALMKSAEFGHVHCMQALMESKADIDFRDKDGVTPIYMAAQNGQADTLLMLLEAKADVNAADGHGITPLFKSAARGLSEIVSILLKANPDVNAADIDGVSPLYMAGQNGHAEALRMLLEAGADANAAESDGVTPLYMAAQNGHAEPVRMLLEAKANVNAASDSGSTPLCMAAQNGHAETVRMLLEAKADVKAADSDGSTPLCMAAQDGHADAVRLLLDAKADVHAASNDGVTPLCMAAHCGHVESVRMLLEAKANLNATESDGVTPLCMAAQNGHAEAVRMLLEAKADLNAAFKGFTALRQALVPGGNFSCVHLLIQAGSDVMVRDSMGETLLMLAVCMEDWESASSLFSVGGYELLSARNCLGLTCLDMVPSGSSNGDNEGAATWVKLVQARDEQCAAFAKNFFHDKGLKSAACLELHRGDKWAVLFNAESNMSAALFRQSATVRAGHCMCPSGSAAYYELQVVCMGECPQWGFCTDAFEQMLISGPSSHGVGDDESSWGVDGDRLLKWHNGESSFGGRKWQDGDVIGLACDLRAESLLLQKDEVKDSDTSGTTPGGGGIWMSLNGDFSPPHSLAFHLPQGLGGLYAAFSSCSGAVRCNLGEEPFKYAPPGEGFMPMCSFSKLHKVLEKK
jgi:ankyrin repeat protein